MLDIKFIREHKELVETAIKNKRSKPVDVDALLAFHDQKKAIALELQNLNEEKNAVARDRNVERGIELKKISAEKEEKLREIDKEFMALMLALPNIPSPDTPVGADENENKIIKKWGEPRAFDFPVKAHWDLGKDLDIIDNERGANISGARFTYLKGDLALLQYALTNFGFSVITNKEILKSIAEKANLDVDIKAFIPVVPPVMVKPAVMNRMARLEPRDERYHIPSDDLYLIGSAEHVLGPLHMDEVFAESQLPVRYAAMSNAFRREAGSYGKDTKGILRVHQFDKLEMESFCLPENSYKEQDFLVAIQEHIMQSLGLPYQIIICCTGDMGDPDHRHLDLETWMPGQSTYRETHSSDHMAGYQARRLNTRVKRADGKMDHVHMNDATLIAVGRTLIAIMENYQNADGTITIPEALKPFMMGKTLITKTQ